MRKKKPKEQVEGEAPPAKPEVLSLGFFRQQGARGGQISARHLTKAQRVEKAKKAVASREDRKIGKK